MNQLSQLFQSHFGESPTGMSLLRGAGSSRSYYRLTSSSKSVIGVKGVSQAENRAFFYFTHQLSSEGIRVPMLYAVSDDEMCYLIEDLGDTSLFDLFAEARANGGHYTNSDVYKLEKVMRCLPHIQLEGARNLDTSKLLPPLSFDEESVMFDLHYFKYCFLRTVTDDFNETLLECDFRSLASDLVVGREVDATELLYRDFQARNVMWHNDAPAFIDYQGARVGPPQYDVVSFLYQCSAQYPSSLRSHLVDVYLEERSKLVRVDVKLFKSRMQHFVLFRLMQVLGAYGLRGKFEHKPHFLQSIPFALKELERVIERGAADSYIELKRVLLLMIKKERERLKAEVHLFPRPAKGLVVSVYSFSFKKGIPIDPSGNGGGYVYDCRAPHNPGRYAEYRQLTGRDTPVIEFLERDGELVPFLSAVYEQIDFHVERYIERHFTHLQVAFGCTGGQHRSVYCAEHLSHHLHEKYGIEVHLYHREQHIRECLK